MNFIPRNLAGRVPDPVSLEAALDRDRRDCAPGFPQSQAVLGEGGGGDRGRTGRSAYHSAAKAAGCRVIAIDLDPQRVEQAKGFGADLALCSGDRDTPARVREFTRARNGRPDHHRGNSIGRTCRTGGKHFSRSWAYRGRGHGESRSFPHAHVQERAFAGSFPLLRAWPLRFSVRRGRPGLSHRLRTLD